MGDAAENVYAAVETELSVRPTAYATALNVAALLSGTGALYTVPTVELGVLPSVVYRMPAPAVAVVIVTVCGVA